MNTDFGFLSSPSNPFAALLSPDIPVAAHERLSQRIVATIHRPLDRYMPNASKDEPSYGDESDSGLMDFAMSQ